MRTRLLAIIGAVCSSLVAACGGAMPEAEPATESWTVGERASPEALPIIVPANTGEPPQVLTAAEWGQPVASTASVPVYTEPGDIPHLQVVEQGGEGEGARLPLEHTHVKARLTGFVAEVEVRQTYNNPRAEPIEAIYVFPLPENSAVDHMRMEIGDRVIEAQIKRREVARQEYEAARREGYTAALLEQERPNIFTQSVANIEPGTRIDVVVRYVQTLTYDAGLYEFVFPMVVGPRFVPGQPLPGPQAGEGTARDTTAVPDASRISPPVLGRGERSGHDISIEVVADSTLPVGEIEVPTHEVATRAQADGSVHLVLTERESIPNRDFVLRYRVAGDEPKATLFLSGEEQEGFFALAVHPPALDVDQLVGQREIIFVVDVSGSMSGTPLSLCRMAMRDALRRLRPVDTFNIITFAGSTGHAFERPRPANDANLRQAFDYVDQMVAGGGTYMANAVDAALSPEVEQGRHRYVFFLTDGYVGNEDQIIRQAGQFVEALEARQQRARVFGFGVGSSVNRHLLEGISSSGRGIAVYSTTREDPARAVNRFFHYIDRAVLEGVSVEWADLGPDAIVPGEVPDLFASHALVLHGRYSRPPTGQLFVNARAGERQVRLPVTVQRAEVEGEPGEVFGSLWARSRVTELEEDLRQGADVQVEITSLGLEHHIVTQFTSFVAVDLSRRVGQGDPTQVVQPVEVPEGVDPDMAGAVPAADDDGTPEPAAEYAVTTESTELRQRAVMPTAPEAPPAGGAPDYEEEASYEDGAAPMEARYRHGCHCRSADAGATDPGSAPLLVLLFALATAALRRGRRRP